MFQQKSAFGDSQLCAFFLLLLKVLLLFVTLIYTHFPAPTKSTLYKNTCLLEIINFLQNPIIFLPCNRLTMSFFRWPPNLRFNQLRVRKIFNVRRTLWRQQQTFFSCAQLQNTEKCTKAKKFGLSRGPKTIQWTLVFSWKLFSRSSSKLINGNRLSATLFKSL